MGIDAARSPTGQAVRASADGVRRPVSARSIVATSLAGVLLLGIAGWLVWTQGALTGLESVEFDSPLSLAVLG